MNKYITPIAKIVSIDSKPMKSNSSSGRWAVYYSIKWNLTDKNKIGTIAYFWYKQEALEWIDKTLAKL